MTVEIFDNYNALSMAAHAWCEKKIKEHNAKSIFIPAGNTPKALYEIWQNTHPSYLENKQLMQIDDIYEGDNKNLFKDFFKNHLGSYYHQLVPVEQGPGVGELCILGLGENGHIGFHEPHLKENFDWGVVDLSELTCRNLGVNYPCKGMTYGAGQFLKAKAILLMVVGKNKKDTYNNLVQNKKQSPAHYLLRHPDFTILVEKNVCF